MNPQITEVRALTKRISMKRSRLAYLAVLVLGLIASMASPSRADTVYSYTGNPLSQITGDGSLLPAGVTALTGSFLLSGPLGANFSGAIDPLSFSFTDGVTNFDGGANSGPLITNFVTNNLGELISWSMKGWIETPGEGQTEFLIQGGTADDQVSYENGAVVASTDVAGKWTVTTPEPPAWCYLLGAGLTVFFFRKWVR
jgi:hypothetical protein